MLIRSTTPLGVVMLYTISVTEVTSPEHMCRMEVRRVFFDSGGQLLSKLLAIIPIGAKVSEGLNPPSITVEDDTSISLHKPPWYMYCNGLEELGDKTAESIKRVRKLLGGTINPRDIEFKPLLLESQLELDLLSAAIGSGFAIANGDLPDGSLRATLQRGVKVGEASTGPYL